MKLYEYDCLNCGKHHIIPASSSAEPKFCDRECWRQYNQKKLDAAEKAKEEARKKRKARMSGIVPQKDVPQMSVRHGSRRHYWL